MSGLKNTNCKHTAPCLQQVCLFCESIIGCSTKIVFEHRDLNLPSLSENTLCKPCYQKNSTHYQQNYNYQDYRNNEENQIYRS
jgi:hypothetical protein